MDFAAYGRTVWHPGTIDFANENWLVWETEFNMENDWKIQLNVLSISLIIHRWGQGNLNIKAEGIMNPLKVETLLFKGILPSH